MNKRMIYRMKSAILEQSAKEGLNNPMQISAITVEALKTIGVNSVAGTKAALTKGQILAHD